MYFLLEKNKKGGFFTMIKNRRTSGLLSMALATCLVVSAVPVQTVDSILGNAAGRVTAYAEETAQSTKPLTTLWKTVPVQNLINQQEVMIYSTLILRVKEI